MTQRHFGSSLHQDKNHDLRLLQRLWDDKIVTADNAQTLQDMGIVLGDLFAKELDMHWVLYTDAKGRSRALQLRHTEHFLFPITMISRRAIAGAEVNVKAIYNKAVAHILPHLDDYSSYRRRILPVDHH
ncbi:DUF3806 domain-containing protein [bacterium]|nr:DUF3806 domain-containing protein [bacterium]